MIGWERTTRRITGRKHPREVIERASVSIQAWELAALGAVALAYLIVKDGILPGWELPSWGGPNPFGIPSVPGNEIQYGFWRTFFPWP